MDSGPFTVASNATLAFGEAAATLSSQSSISGNGTVVFDNKGTTTIYGGYSIGGVMAYATAVDGNGSNVFGTINLTTGLFTRISTTAPLFGSLTAGPGGTLYGGEGKLNLNLDTISPTGATSQFGTVAAPSSSLGFLGLASAGAAGFFADSVINMPSISAYTATLDRVSADGSSSSVVGTMGSFSSFNSGNLAFGPDGNLYFDAQALPVDYSGAVATLYSVNTNTGVATAVGSGLRTDHAPLALVSDGTTLYGIDAFQGGNPTIYTINTTTGAETDICYVTGLPSPVDTLDTLAYVPEPAPVTLPRTFVQSNAVVRFGNPVTLTDGTLQVDGTLASASPVTVPTGGTLDGIGTVSATVNVQAGGHLSPTATLTTTNTTLTTGANFDVDLNGTGAGTGYNQLNSTGTVSLGGANLNLSGSFTPVPGNVFTIVSAASVTGTFNGLAQNATIPFNGVSLKVSYTPTTVTLTDPSTAPTIMSPTVTNVTSTTATLGGDVTGSGGARSPNAVCCMR